MQYMLWANLPWISNNSTFSDDTTCQLAEYFVEVVMF